MNKSRRNLLQTVVAGAPLVALAGVGDQHAVASPNGTRPTILTNLAVVAVNSTTMKVSGKLTTLSNYGIAGMRVDIYSVGEASFTRWATVYTDNSGNFSVTTSKVPAGNKVQIEVEGNGAYSRPLPTFNRP